MVKLNDLIGPDAMNATIKQLALKRTQPNGQSVLDAFMANIPANLKPQVQALIDASFAKPR